MMPHPEPKTNAAMALLLLVSFSLVALVMAHGQATGKETVETGDDQVTVGAREGQVGSGERSRLPAVGFVVLSIMCVIMIRRVDT